MYYYIVYFARMVSSIPSAAIPTINSSKCLVEASYTIASNDEGAF